MSRLAYRSSQSVVYDDVVPMAAFTRLSTYLAGQDFNSVHRTSWRKVWRLHDGDPLRTKTAWYQPDGDVRPTGTALDDLVEWIASRIEEIEPVVGAPGKDWVKLSLTTYLYPVGAGLSLHRDGTRYSGAFTFFAHPEWRLHWGGQLLVLDPRTRSRSDPAEPHVPAYLDDREESARAFDPGFATAVFARPNRIAFIAPSALHLVTRVDANAGQAARLSVAGFFHKA